MSILFLNISHVLPLFPGMSVNILDKEGGSALFHAVLQRKKAVAKLLLKYGADVNLNEACLDGFKGVSPLMTAVRYRATYTDSHGESRQVNTFNYLKKLKVTKPHMY